MDEVFDGSLRLLDLCSASKDGVIHTKECVRELQSLVRRRSSSWCCGNGVVNQVCVFNITLSRSKVDGLS